MRLTKSKLRQLIKEELRIIKENIGAGSIEEDLEKIIGEFRETLDGVFSYEIIAAADLARLNSTVESLRKIINENIGAQLEEHLKEIIGEFQETLNRVEKKFKRKLKIGYDLARLHAILRSLKTVVGDIYQGEYDKDTQTEDPNKTHSNF